MLLFGEQLAERLAGFNRLVVGRFTADDALTDELAARGLDVVFPIAHPFAVAPAVGAEQTHGLAGQAGLDGLADVLGVDDSKWSLSIARGDRTGGSVVVHITC